MNSEIKSKSKFREVLNIISNIISWTIFVLLLICAAFLIYYFIATRVYVKKGSGYEPKFSLYTIISPSMVPNINVYDVVIDVRVDKPEDIKINDVITFNSSIPEVHGGTITHRVIAISKDTEGNYLYQTKGDNNLIEDGVKVPYNSIVGKVALRIPKLGNVQKLLATSSGWIMLITLVAVYILVKGFISTLRARVSDKLDNGSKFAKFLNRPLIPYRKRKLLTYTPKEEVENMSVSEPEKAEEQIENEEIINEIKPKPLFIEEAEDDFDLDDLPKLK